MGRGEEKKKNLNRIEKQILRLHLGTTFAYAFAFFCFSRVCETCGYCSCTVHEQ